MVAGAGGQISSEDIEDFHRDGAVLLRGVLSQSGWTRSSVI